MPRPSRWDTGLHTLGLDVLGQNVFKSIVMTFLVRNVMEAQRSKNFKEFYRILIGKQCNLVNIRG
jgi:hypothetical protein